MNGACVLTVGKEDEERRPRLPRNLERVDPGERELIGQCEPAELRPSVIEPQRAVDVVEPVERAFGPVLPQPRHDGDRPVAVPLERVDERVALLGHQDARSCAGRAPRRPTTGEMCASHE